MAAPVLKWSHVHHKESSLACLFGWEYSEKWPYKYFCDHKGTSILFFVMSSKEQTSGSLEAEVKEEENPDVGNKKGSSDETNPLPSVIAVDVPALISDEIANFPEKPKNPEVTSDPLEQSLGGDDQPSQQAGPSRSLSFLEILEISQEQPASAAAGSVLNKQTEADSTTANDNSIKSLPENGDRYGAVNTANGEVFAKETEEVGEKRGCLHPKKRKWQKNGENGENGEKEGCLHPKKRKWETSEESQDPLCVGKASKTVVTFMEESERSELQWRTKHVDTTDENLACWTNCHVTIDNSWINPSRMSKEVQRILKIRLEKMEESAAEKEEKLKAAYGKVVEMEEMIARLTEKDEKHREAIGVLNKELKDQKEKHMNDLSKQVRAKTDFELIFVQRCKKRKN